MYKNAKAHTPLKDKGKKLRQEYVQREKDRKKQRGKKIQKTVDYPQNCYLKGIHETLKSTRALASKEV